MKRSWWLLAFLVGVTACEQGSQSARNVPLDADLVIAGNAVTCPDCRIEFRPLATLGNSQDPAGFRPDVANCMVGRLSAGEFVVSALVGGGQLFVYGMDGTLRRTIGRPGPGPGEFGAMSQVLVSREDSLYVFDFQRRTVQVLTKAGDFVRSFQAPDESYAIAMMPDGRFVFSVASLDPNANAFVATDSEGAEEARFGGRVMHDPMLDLWRAFPTDRGALWTTGNWQYTFSRWSGPSEPGLTILRDVEWFRTLPVEATMSFLEDSQWSVVSHVSEDESGLLWTYATVVGERWRPMIASEPPEEWMREYWDMMTEVIDVENGSVVATKRHREHLRGICGSHLVYSVTDSLDPQIVVWEPVLVRG